jgi:hypothetical protein
MNKPKRKGRMRKPPPGKVYRDGKLVTRSEAARMAGYARAYSRLLIKRTDK